MSSAAFIIEYTSDGASWKATGIGSQRYEIILVKELVLKTNQLTTYVN